MNSESFEQVRIGVRAPRRGLLVFLLASSLLVFGPGCPWWFFPDDGWDEPEPPPDPIENTHPRVTHVEVQIWPPLGPDDEIEIRVEDEDGNLEQVVLRFRNTLEIAVEGESDVVRVTGSDLGEGYGALTILVADSEGWTSTRVIDDLLVDLTPPRAIIGSSVLRADGEGDNGALRAWIGDAWIIGGAELHFQGEVFVQEVDEGWPSTLGRAWDWTLLTFPATDLPSGSGLAELRIFDAAGNEAVEEFELVVDDSPPETSILSPDSGEMVSGRFTVVVEARDAGGGPVWIELYAGGNLMATAAGPIAEILIDANELPLGEIELVAFAVDLAGYETMAEPVVIVVE